LLSKSLINTKAASSRRTPRRRLKHHGPII